MDYAITLTILGVSFFLLINQIALTLIYRNGAASGQENIKKYPKVSILKPVSNIEDGMEQNIESFYAVDYPDYEIIFGINAPKNHVEVLGELEDIIKKVRTRHKETFTKILPIVFDRVVNPKITVLTEIETHATGELYWVTDGNVRVEKDTLKKLVAEYVSSGSKIVFSPIRGTGSGNFWSILENAYLNFFVSPNVIAVWKYLKKQIIVGKSMLIEKRSLLDFGGFGRFKDFLAEDYIMGEIYEARNLSVSTNFTWVTNYISTASFMKLWSRVERWAKLRYNIKRAHYFFEILLNPIAISLLSLAYLGRRGLGILAAVVVLKVVLEYAGFFAVNIEDRKKPWIIIIYPLAVIAKDILMFLIYPTPFLSKKVFWRGRKIKISRNTKILEMT